MCGIAGVLHARGVPGPVDEELLVRMRETMRHRGPDGAGLWTDPERRVGLAHRRLAIVDLSGSAGQPMPNEDGTVQVVFNGEIYNHRGLRQELEGRGHRFRSDHSDTEVIVHGYEEWGIDCVHRFRGMFAFGLWDGRDAGELWLVRDRVGIKPLYYASVGGRLLFASEMKAILEDPAVPRVVDREALYHYLSFLATPAPATLLRDVRKLPGGTRARVGPDGRLRTERYWDVWDETSSLAGVDDEEIARRVLGELRASVSLRKMADVPVGVFLSGGIDSSTNAVLFAEGEERPVRTFSIGYDADYRSYRNEFDYAREMARRVGADHRERRLTLDDALDAMPGIVRHQDEPISDPVCIPVYYVSKLARDDGVTVCQVGEGSDELFWGYPQWKDLLGLERKSRLPVPGFVRRLGLLGLRGLGHGGGFPYERLRRSAEGRPVFWGGAEALPEAVKRELVAPGLRRELGGMTSWEAIRPIRERFEERAPRPDSILDWMSYLDLNLRLPELLLMRVDKMSMMTSLECRVPFLDHEFVGLAMSIPQEVKTRDGELKGILKRAVGDLLPREILDRPKQGFGVPVDEWLGGALGERIRDEVASFADASGLLRPDACREHIGVGAGAHGVWTLYNLALWWRSYVAGEGESAGVGAEAVPGPRAAWSP